MHPLLESMAPGFLFFSFHFFSFVFFLKIFFLILINFDCGRHFAYVLCVMQGACFLILNSIAKWELICNITWGLLLPFSCTYREKSRHDMGGRASVASCLLPCSPSFSHFSPVTLVFSATSPTPEHCSYAQIEPYGLEEIMSSRGIQPMAPGAISSDVQAWVLGGIWQGGGGAGFSSSHCPHAATGTSTGCGRGSSGTLLLPKLGHFGLQPKKVDNW